MESLVTTDFHPSDQDLSLVTAVLLSRRLGFSGFSLQHFLNRYKAVEGGAAQTS